MDFSNKKPGTIAVWAGESEEFYQRATVPPVVNSVTFGYDEPDEWYEVATGQKEGHIYSRSTNPTVRVLEEKIRILEEAEEAIAFATGMAAISNTLFSLLSPGDRVISIKDSYGGTSKIFLEHLPRFNVEVMLCETTDHDQIEHEISKGCKLLYLESPTNPTLKILDLRRLIESAKKQDAIAVVDNTFATPINQKPLNLGADVVVHSATKFLGGHSDVMGGLACGRRELIDTIYRFREVNGAALHADAAYLIIRGMKTLELRIRRQNENALRIAVYLSGHPKISEVFYPGLETHPGHTIAKNQMEGFGGVLSFSLRADLEKVKQFLTKLEIVHLAASLGSVSTLAGQPQTTSHVEISAEQRKQLGIPESLVRYSVGIENSEDLIEDIGRALESI